MKYHNITHDDMLNGEGLRVVLWLSGCKHLCDGCQNSITFNYNNGLNFDYFAKQEIFRTLEKNYINGLTLSGGDPLFDKNLDGVLELINEVKLKFPTKTIWLYTGYTYEEILSNEKLFNVVKEIDVLIEGKFEKSLVNVNYHWAGSTNQRVINIKDTLEGGSIVLYENIEKRWYS